VDVYERMAGLYDLIYGGDIDLGFYLREAKNARGPVLEVACGTGRIMLHLLSQKIDIVGIDLSPGMLGVLRKKAEAQGLKPDVQVADMTDFDLSRRFKLIIVPYRSFLHLKDESQRRKAINRFHDHLLPGGRLILHTYNPSKEEMEMTGGYHAYESEEVGSRDDPQRYRVDWQLMYDPRHRAGNYRIILKPEKGGAEEFEMTIYYVPAKEMQEMLSSAGFRNIKEYCGFDYSRSDEACKEAIWIAEK
jgi:SAM-dependent methyltransferase